MTVTVVGGGIAGAVAAVAAARHRDRRVELLTDGETSLGAASGLVDVLGYTPDGEGPLTDPFDAIPGLPEGHPYSAVGVEGVRAGLALFDEIAGDRYRGAGTDRNALVPTYQGNLKPTARYPASVAPGLASREEPTMLAGFERLTAFDAPLAGEKLSTVLPYHLNGTTVEFPKEFAEPPDAVDFAESLEADESPDGPAAYANSVRRTLASRVKTYMDVQHRVGLPAVLGTAAVASIRETMQEQLNARVFEIPMGPPSVPGRRLRSALYDGLAAAGVAIRPGTRVTGAESADGRITALTAERDGETVTVETEAVVLATGGLVGGGVEADRERVREPVFGCHVPHPGDRYEWFDGAALGDHPFARFGVETDGELRPLDARGEPEYENLRAAGSVLGGYDYAAEKSGSGVSLATGTVAGRLAAE